MGGPGGDKDESSSDDEKLDVQVDRNSRTKDTIVSIDKNDLAESSDSDHTSDYNSVDLPRLYLGHEATYEFNFQST